MNLKEIVYENGEVTKTFYRSKYDEELSEDDDEELSEDDEVSYNDEFVKLLNRSIYYRM